MSRKDDQADRPASETPDSTTATPQPGRLGCVLVEEPEPPYFDERRVVQRLRAAVTEERGTTASGIQLLRGTPVSLLDSIHAELTPEARRAFDELWIDYEIVVDEHCSPRRLLTFLWQSAGPMMWGCTIGSCEVAGQLFFTVTTEEGEFVVAAVDEGDLEAAAPTFLRDYFRSNGEAYGLPLFGSMPTATENYAPDIVVPELVALCYTDVLEYFAANSDPHAWSRLEETLIEQKAAPDTQTYVLDHLDRYFSQGYREASERYHAERSAELDSRAKAYVLARYLGDSYREYRQD